MKLSRTIYFESQKIFLVLRPVLQFHFLPQINNADSEICAEYVSSVHMSFLLEQRFES